MTQTFEYTNYVETSSSAIDAIWYNRKNGNLAVEFVGGALAAYRNVPEVAFSVFSTANSVGSHFSGYIKNRYSGLSIERDTVFVDVSQKPVAEEKGRQFSITANLSVSFSKTVEAGTLEAALKAFEQLVTTAMEGNKVNIDFTEVKTL